MWIAGVTVLKFYPSWSACCMIRNCFVDISCCNLQVFGWEIAEMKSLSQYAIKTYWKWLVIHPKQEYCCRDMGLKPRDEKCLKFTFKILSVIENVRCSPVFITWDRWLQACNDTSRLRLATLRKWMLQQQRFMNHSCWKYFAALSSVWNKALYPAHFWSEIKKFKVDWTSWVMVHWFVPNCCQIVNLQIWQAHMHEKLTVQYS